ncbi:MAG: hypothetical protein WBZ48_10605 [Bacteroidota bacterium]
MAWMESATVAYLRTLLHRVEPYQESPLPISDSFGMTELIREAATLVMLISAGWLAGKLWRSRLGFFMLAFGIWDIFYYLFLKVIVGWPHSFFDWDVLFLIPVPWWGPALSPMLVSLVLIIFGSVLILNEFDESPFRAGKLSWSFHLFGIVIALYLFMAHSIKVLAQDSGGIHTQLPDQFSWPLFDLALSFMLMPILEMVIRNAKAQK